MLANMLNRLSNMGLKIDQLRKTKNKTQIHCFYERNKGYVAVLSYTRFMVSNILLRNLFTSILIVSPW